MTAPSPPTAEPLAAPVRVRRARPDDAATVQALLLELAAAALQRTTTHARTHAA